MPDIIERLKRGHQGSGIGPLDCHDALQEIERLQDAKRRALAIADERAAAANALAQAMDQLLDDMGKHGMSVCLAAKAQGRIAYEPFRDKEEDDDHLMSLEEAKRILKECER